MRKALKALFHASVNVNPIGEIGMSIPPNGKTLDELEMWASDDGALTVDCKYKGMTVSFLIPAANCRVLTLAPLSKEKPSIKVHD